ncbi:MAG: hypothetical protein ACE5KJ_08035, partial [Candidatus Zixiibacteriota bacterium]
MAIDSISFSLIKTPFDGEDLFISAIIPLPSLMASEKDEKPSWSGLKCKGAQLVASSKKGGNLSLSIPLW